MMNLSRCFSKWGRSVGLSALSGLLVSCGYDARAAQKALREAQARAHDVRTAFHRDQQRWGYDSQGIPQAEEVLDEARYYRVPVEEHVNEDGLIIDAHHTTLKIIQP